MLKYRVKLPDHQIKLMNDQNAVVGERNVIVHLIGLMIENFVKQKSDTEAYIIRKIRDKIDNVQGDSIILEKEEVHILTETIKSMQQNGQIIGSNWYFLIDGLRSAEEIKDKPHETKQEEK